jgi:3,4-dihydroxy 2-butanone 4-phosphate synthase/GTP cyclohydrolase II
LKDFDLPDKNKDTVLYKKETYRFNSFRTLLNDQIDMNTFKLNTINEAIEEIRQGNFVIVVDDEDRENEGDFITAAELITPEKVNFMITHGRGLVCAPISEERCQELDLEMQTSNNTSMHETPFTVSVDLLGNNCTTGISAFDRAATILALCNPKTHPSDLGRPGHIFPLRARSRGVLRRAGHTEAAMDLAQLAGLYPAGVLVEIMNKDGSMARLPDLIAIAEKFNMKIISVKDLIAYRLQRESLVEKGVEVEMPTVYGNFRLIPFLQKSNGLEHVALIKGTWEHDEPILVRVHSSCITGDIFGSMRCDCGDQLHRAMQMIEKEGKGALVYMNQEGRGIGLMNKIKAYHLQENGYDTVEANLHLGFEADERDYGVGAQILREIGVANMRLMTNNPVKRIGLESYGLQIVEIVPIEIQPNPFNQFYLQTKKERMGHVLKNIK